MGGVKHNDGAFYLGYLQEAFKAACVSLGIPVPEYFHYFLTRASVDGTEVAATMRHSDHDRHQVWRMGWCFGADRRL